MGGLSEMRRMLGVLRDDDHEPDLSPQPTLADVDVINICVPTPLRKTRDPDVSYIAAAVDEIRKHLPEGTRTVSPGERREQIRIRQEHVQKRFRSF